MKVTLNKVQQKRFNSFKTNSAKIRYLLLTLKYERGPVSKFMNISYQYVRNVHITPFKNAMEDYS